MEHRALFVTAFVVAVVSFGGRTAAEPPTFDLAVKGRALAEDQRVVRVRQGDDVTLRWTTDEPVMVHLHGYDLESRITPDTPVSMKFRARAAGRFPIETHAQGRDGERTLGYLEVLPR